MSPLHALAETELQAASEKRVCRRIVGMEEGPSHWNVAQLHCYPAAASVSGAAADCSGAAEQHSHIRFCQQGSSRVAGMQHDLEPVQPLDGRH